MAKITQEDAVRQAREMHARARREPPPPECPPPPQPHPPEPSPPEGPLDPLFRDSERTLLLALLLLLSDEGNHQELVFALLYLLI